MSDVSFSSDSCISNTILSLTRCRWQAGGNFFGGQAEIVELIGIVVENVLYKLDGLIRV